MTENLQPENFPARRAGSPQPRILYFTPYWPHRASCASELRAHHVLRALQEIGEVQVVVVDAEGGGDEWAQLAEKPFHVLDSLKVAEFGERGFLRKLSWATNPRVQYPHGCGVAAAAAGRVLAAAKDFDLVWFCKLRTPNMFAQWRWPRAVADIDDVPSTFERSVLKTGLGFKEKLLTQMRVRSWVRQEKLLGERFSVLGVCSEGDQAYLQSLGVRAPIHVIPNGYELPAQPPVRQPASPPRLGFIGIFDYEPNLQGIRWFAEKCWPLVKQKVPAARLRLVGRMSDGPCQPAGRDIDGLGWVPDVTKEMATWSAMIVPIQLGAGTRGKIAHGFSQQCPIVSTNIGAYGYGARDGEEMFLPDRAEDFAAACVNAMQQPDVAAAMAQKAHQQFLEKWTWDAIRPRIWAAAEAGLRQPASA